MFAKLKKLFKINKRDNKERLRDLEGCIDIQSQPGNWNYDGYMHGMLNGMILAQSIITDSEPKFYEAPDKWIHDETKPS